MTDVLLCHNSCGWHHYCLCFHENTAYTLKKRAIKIGTQKFWPSYHYSSVVQTASNWNLQKLLKSEL